MNNKSSSIVCFGFLTLLFIALKLMGYINWSWLIVLLPLYGGFILFLMVVFFLFIINIVDTNSKK